MGMLVKLRFCGYKLNYLSSRVRGDKGDGLSVTASAN